MGRQRFLPFSLASDNTSGAHPKIMQALMEANQGYATAYGKDICSDGMDSMFSELFGQDVTVSLVMNGTGANVAAISALLGRVSGIVCPETAHINTHESGAPDRLLGAKIYPQKHVDGKILPETLDELEPLLDNFHAARPDVLSISNTTELGAVYSPAEVKALCDKAHALGMKVHMDGARFANAVAALDCHPNDIAGGAGVDVLCFGGTKNGLMYGEALIFFTKEAAFRFDYLRKQYLQLASKGRFLAAQFEAVLRDNLWLEMGRNANAMARKLAEGIKPLKNCTLRAPVESNQVFADVPESWEEPLCAIAPFLYMEDGAARFVTSFDTQPEQIDSFIAELRRLDG